MALKAIPGTGAFTGNKQATIVKTTAIAGMVLSALAITILSLLPNPPQPDIDIPYLDKIEHFIAYAVLGGLTAGSFWKKRQRPVVLGAIVLLCSLFGGILEIFQFYTGRSTELGDLLADFLGCTGGVIAGQAAFAAIFRKAGS